MSHNSGLIPLWKAVIGYYYGAESSMSMVTQTWAVVGLTLRRWFSGPADFGCLFAAASRMRNRGSRSCLLFDCDWRQKRTRIG